MNIVEHTRASFDEGVETWRKAFEMADVSLTDEAKKAVVFVVGQLARMEDDGDYNMARARVCLFGLCEEISREEFSGIIEEFEVLAHDET